MIKIFGHTAPDTDATASALIWAWYLNDIIKKPATAYVLGAPNTEADFVLKRWGFEMPELLNDVADGDKVVIVDTNNPAELPANIKNADIRQIIDHHLLVGGLSTKGPINVTIRPVAATATVMYSIMREPALDNMPDAIKGLILSCILSDTLEFRSPTTTPRDTEVANRMAKDLNIDIASYAAEMFAAKSDISHFSDAELLRLDSKILEVDSTKFRVSVLETTSPDTVLNRKSSLIDSMKTVASEDGVDQVLLFVVDILNEQSTMLIPNDAVKSVAEKSFNTTVSSDSVILPGVVSRKKQIIPNLKS
ncbi:MAG TPA: manganese-dependent inorganic pyrophosphatase [Rhodobacteraceae bacterium]|jgi:manganese-dependent inorganic pyrophosphatase|nr:manganese-dependent inorganic pyrophosphatase [Paracoccaceae bacterium]